MCTEHYVHYSKIDHWIQGYYIYAHANSEKKPCDVIYLLSISELCWWKTTYFSNLNLQNRKGFSTRFASLPHFTTVTLPRVHKLECMNQWENKQLFTIFIFENVCNIFRNEINIHCQLFATHYRSSPGNFLISVKKIWESDFKSLEIINIVYVRLLNCKLLH